MYTTVLYRTILEPQEILQDVNTGNSGKPITVCIRISSFFWDDEQLISSTGLIPLHFVVTLDSRSSVGLADVEKYARVQLHTSVVYPKVGSITLFAVSIITKLCFYT